MSCEGENEARCSAPCGRRENQLRTGRGHVARSCWTHHGFPHCTKHCLKTRGFPPPPESRYRRGTPDTKRMFSNHVISCVHSTGRTTVEKAKHTIRRVVEGGASDPVDQSADDKLGDFCANDQIPPLRCQSSDVSPGRTETTYVLLNLVFTPTTRSSAQGNCSAKSLAALQRR